MCLRTLIGFSMGLRKAYFKGFDGLAAGFLDPCAFTAYTLAFPKLAELSRTRVLYAYTYAYMYMYVYVCMCIYIYIDTCTSREREREREREIYTHMYIAHAHAHAHACISISIYIYIYTCSSMYICAYTHPRCARERKRARE